MGYSDNEISSEDGQPVALYQFYRGNTYWRYTTCDEDVEDVGFDEDGNPATWLSKAITDEGVTQGGSDQNDLQILMPAELPVPQLFRGGQPSGKLWLTVRRYHLGDDPTETPIQWMGTVTNSVLQDDGITARVFARTLGGTFDRMGLRLGWQRQCPHPLYGPGCFVPMEEHEYPHTIATMSNSTFTVSSYADPTEGSFSGGLITWERPDGSLEKRGIEYHTGNDFRVFGRLVDLAPGQAVKLYPGCPRSTTGCKAFSNLPNYGGIPHLARDTPFSAKPLFG
jgi:hypothetical protein